MQIKKINNGNKLTMRISGRLDTITAPELEKEVCSSLDGVKELVMDFSDLEYISSAGLRVLLSVSKRMAKGSFVIRNCSDEIKEIFDVTGFLDIFTVE